MCVKIKYFGSNKVSHWDRRYTTNVLLNIDRVFKLFSIIVSIKQYFNIYSAWLRQGSFNFNIRVTESTDLTVQIFIAYIILWIYFWIARNIFIARVHPHQILLNIDFWSLMVYSSLSWRFLIKKIGALIFRLFRTNKVLKYYEKPITLKTIKIKKKQTWKDKNKEIKELGNKKQASTSVVYGEKWRVLFVISLCESWVEEDLCLTHQRKYVASKQMLTCIFVFFLESVRNIISILFSIPYLYSADSINYTFHFL